MEGDVSSIIERLYISRAPTKKSIRALFDRKDLQSLETSRKTTEAGETSENLFLIKLSRQIPEATRCFDSHLRLQRICNGWNQSEKSTIYTSRRWLRIVQESARQAIGFSIDENECRQRIKPQTFERVATVINGKSGVARLGKLIPRVAKRISSYGSNQMNRSKCVTISKIDGCIKKTVNFAALRY